MKIETDKRDLLELVKHAHKGNIVLPQFQRDFVWPKSNIIDLLVSIL